MNVKTIILSVLLLGCLQSSIAQKYASDYTVQFRHGDREWASNLNEFIASSVDNSEVVNGLYFRYVQFLNIPNETMISEIRSYGLELLEYIPHKTYLVSIPKSFDRTNFMHWGVRSVQRLLESDKLHEQLGERPFPEHAIKGDKIELIVSYFKSLKHKNIVTLLEREGFEVTTEEASGNYIRCLASVSNFEDFAALPFVRFVEIVDAPGESESTEGTSMHRSNMINNSLPGGRRFDGSGIRIGIFDEKIGPHIDFNGRIAPHTVQSSGNHGDMVAGIAAGAGNLNPTAVGMAPGATIHMLEYYPQLSSDALSYHLNDSVMIFTTSKSNGCNAGYTSITRTVDQQIFNNKELLQVYSAGNDNFDNCGYGAGDQWGNITGGHKQAKNVIATANLERDLTIRASSSRGPAYDGRIKPDISAHGQGQLSTRSNNSYALGSGTSAAAPNIGGISAQLYQAYRDFNGGAYPESGLIKACILNGAKDLGNVGPDYIFGWGKVDANQALLILEQNQYMSGSISQGASNTHLITVPTGQSIGELRVMVYWMEPEASTQAARSLINDLDMELTSPTGTVSLPWLLDHSPNAAALGSPAGTGVDDLNNMEQVVINNPVAGTYSLNLTGSIVPFGSHNYYVVYTFIEDEIKVTYPLGGEGFVPGEVEVIHWDAYGDAGTFSIEYSIDNGGIWNSLGTVNGNSRHYFWSVPSAITGQALVRVSRNGQSDESDANFSIVELPQNIEFDSVCVNKVTIVWDSVSGATEYAIYKLGNQYMEVIGNSTSNYFTDTNFDTSIDQWYAVQAKGPNNMKGRRSNAVRFQPSCYLHCTIADDAGIRSISSPGEIFYDCNSGVNVDVVLENLGPVDQTNFNVSYQIDNGNIVSENYTGLLQANSNTTFSFSSQPTGLSSGTHTLSVWTDLLSDGTDCNDTLIIPFDFVPASAVSFPYTMDFEGVFPPSNWTIKNPDNSFTWESISTIGSDGNPTNCAYVNNFDYPNLDRNDYMYSTPVDLTGAVYPALVFDVAYIMLSSWNSDSLRIEISADCGVTFTEIFSKSGSVLATVPWQTSSFSPDEPDDWREETIHLTSFLNSEVMVRFINGTRSGNNLYLDNIKFIDLAAPPSAQFSTPITSICAFETIEFTDKSEYLLYPPTSWNWQITPNTYNFVNGTNANSQNPQVEFTSFGTFDISLIATNAYGSNTAVLNQYITVGASENLPLIENFDNLSTCNTIGDCELLTCTLTSGWKNLENDVEDDTDWLVHTGASTNGSLTSDHTSGNGNYALLSGSTCANKESILVSPCFDLNGLSSASLSFWLHMSGNYQGELHVDIFVNGAWTNDIIPVTSGNQGNEWLNKSADLSPYLNQNVRIRFRGIAGTWPSDMAIDDLYILENASPIADFSSSTQITCPGESIQFTDHSWHIPTSWSWQISPNTVSFEGGTSPNSQNPLITFLEPGDYSITLTTYNSDGSGQKVNNNYVNILTPEALNVLENFNFGTPSNWEVPWNIQYVTNLSGSTSNAVQLKFNTLANGAERAITTNLIDLGSAVEPALVFDIAYAWTGVVSNDKLRVDVSTDCKQTFSSTSYDLTGFHLITTSPQALGWVPGAATDWRRDTVLLSSFSGENAYIKLVGTSAGNQTSIFLDNINVVDLNGININTTSRSPFGITIQPNPNSGEFNIVGKGLQDESTSIKIIGIQGRLVKEVHLTQFSGDSLSHTLNVSDLPKGIYFLQVINGGKVETKRLVIH